MRKVLGSSKIKDSDRPKVFKKLFGYYDEGIYKISTNKFKGLVDHNTRQKNRRIFDERRFCKCSNYQTRDYMTFSNT